MAYTTINDGRVFFNTILYEGNEDNSGIQAQTGVGFQPDLVWVKNIEGAYGHIWVDSVRGVGQTLTSRSTAAEEDEAGTVEVFGSDGFTVGQASQAAGPAVNQDEKDHVAWCWKCETAFSNDASATSVGSIDSVGKVNTDAGFSIITYTGTGSAGTIAHGLGVTPAWIVVKRRSATEHWQVYHAANTAAPATDYLQLSTDEATVDAATRWNDTNPTSTVFSVNAHASVNADGSTYVAYCWAEKQGYSKFGSYIGNANDEGTFVYTGFKPAWIMIKNTSAGSTDWLVYDNKRGATAAAGAVGYGNNNKYFIRANTTAAEANETFDMYSNGFKPRITNAVLNGSGNTLVYMAFAEHPFVTSTGVPATAR